MIEVCIYKCTETKCIDKCKFIKESLYFGTRVRNNYGDPVIRVYNPFKKRWVLFGGKHKPGNFKNSLVPLEMLFDKATTLYYKNNKVLEEVIDNTYNNTH